MYHVHTQINQEDSPPIDIDSENIGDKCPTKEPMILPPQGLSRHHPTTQHPPPVQIYCIQIISGLHAGRISEI
jgi:hypothetical protein